MFTVLKRVTYRSDHMVMFGSGCSRTRLAIQPVLMNSTGARRHMKRLQSHAHAFESSPLHTDMLDALRAVRVASQACMSVQRSLQQDSINTKTDDSPVTIADYAAQAIVAWILQQSCNGRLKLVAEETSSDMLGEENAATLVPEVTSVVNQTLQEAFEDFKQLSDDDVVNLIDLGDSEGGSDGKHWVLDPIDGTRGFENKRQYSVCLGLIQDGEPVLGTLGCPNMPAVQFTSEYAGPRDDAGVPRDGFGRLFAAIKDCGTYETDLLNQELPDIRCTAAEVPVEEALFMESYDSRHSNHSTTSKIATALSIQKPPMQLDSQCKYGLLSRGDAQLFMRFPHASYREKIWDHAAGVVIFEEAGGLVTDGMGHKLDFGLGRYLDGLQNGIVAAAPSTHAAVITAVKQHV